YLAQVALHQMTGERNPATGAVEVALEEARQTIEILDMLKVKTEGNLNVDEKRTLDELLYHLKLEFSRRAAAPRRYSSWRQLKGAGSLSHPSHQAGPFFWRRLPSLLGLLLLSDATLSPPPRSEEGQPPQVIHLPQTPEEGSAKAEALRPAPAKRAVNAQDLLAVLWQRRRVLLDNNDLVSARKQ